MWNIKNNILTVIDDVKWIHLVNPTYDKIDSIVEKYDLHEIIEQDLKETNTQDKIDVYDDLIFIILHFPKYQVNIWKHFSNEFNIIIWKNFIISMSKHPTRTIQEIKDNYLDIVNEEDWTDEEKTLRKSPYYILYKILDSLYDKTLVSLKRFSNDLFELENKMFEEDVLNKNLLSTLMKKWRNITFLKNLVLPHEEIIDEINNITKKMNNWDLDVYFEDLQYKSDKVSNIIKTLYVNVESLSNKYNTLVTLKTNSLMSILTIVTLILWFLTLITWFYWMNVNLPWQNISYMWFVIILLMVLLTILMFLLFRKKHII